jgi:hypothetical protein
VLVGRVFLASFLLREGLFVSEVQLRRVVKQVNPEGLSHRTTHKSLKRREYNVVAPLKLVNIDGHHALDRYGLITHGCIDGATRIVLYLLCADNNLPEMPLGAFVRVCYKYQVPECVR